MSIWDNLGLLEELERKRNSLRAGGKRLTFDCLNLKCSGDKAVCSEGWRLSLASDGALTLLTVLKGISSGSCKDCKDFITEEENPNP